MSRQYLTRQNAGLKGINALLAVLCPVTSAAAPLNAVAGSLVVDPAGANNQMTYTAKRKGVYGNGISVAYVTPTTPSAALSIAVVDKAITVNLATDAGTVQVETASVTAAAGATGDGNLPVTITSALLGAPITVQVPLLQATHTTADLIAAAIRAALTADPAASAKWTFTGATNAVIMTRKAAFAAANDATENLAWTGVLGVTAVVNSANTTPGVAPAASSTAAQVKTAVDASAAASALVTVANSGGDNGTGACAAVASAPFTSGADGTDADPYQQLTYGGYLYINVTDTRAVPGATDTWYKTQLTLVS